MKNLRTYGKAPFNVALIHGGPGASGEMAPVARELSASGIGILEPLQTATSIRGQVEELKTVLKKNIDNPITLIGFSWGAWLSYIFTASYPTFVTKLILIGSGSFEEKYNSQLLQTRLKRLSKDEKRKAKNFFEILENPASENKNRVFMQFGELLLKADAYDPIEYKFKEIDCCYDLFQSVWKDAELLRKSGKLLEIGKHIKCPVVAIHGDNDPHPAEGVQKPLSAILKNFKFILLKNCGHIPWIERQAKDFFFEILKQKIQNTI